MSIAQNLNKIKASIPESVTLVAVSKTKPISDLMEAYQAGQRIFGENKIQEMTQKWEVMPKDIQWHMIGHVQTNKVKFMAEYVSLIHGVDSLKLLEEINKQAKKCDRIIACLLQIYIAKEETKFGLDEKELNELLASTEFKSFQNIKIVGLMGMATFTENQNQIKKEFTHLKSIFDNSKSSSIVNCQLSILSMGMSGDYKLAIESGSTMVRIGSSIFGGR
ncbi:YggS family pyridoxal phosphate-dependent enzyme [Flavobacterium psychrophilum]|uniref:YggS family pyridoxal phosphate-dependent enzyme n=1 Tax=Flavobacterium psychrophilum TaxID=96345 RepID=UPI00073E992A|nr:YggS family pyridoxal phosphate-dependent enzyme [Flavobacterium psychrophilum]EKT4520515.1 YggS family pyridoxal phosphate-dependent enzyme [Flavobacterium psychrophilum]ELI6455673.1 YggS family pyridoxal phosphate-dependent enzyme [Flavobacterium psychrophilum]ELM3644503.1 YggS family pyridoxal phosphate-dependent enzyme [Flavobacterium psychrophilum]ELV7525987.1 YggS family pyridoxal phosphate-dependent enzyme [Flavobacterium psychrophilum]MCB6000792.1 YggS family pyridoxal phosphate-dep